MSDFFSKLNCQIDMPTDLKSYQKSSSKSVRYSRACTCHRYVLAQTKKSPECPCSYQCQGARREKGDQRIRIGFVEWNSRLGLC